MLGEIKLSQSKLPGHLMGSKYFLYCIRDLNLHDAVWGLHGFPSVSSDSILQKLLSFSRDLVLQAIVHSYPFYMPVDFIPLQKDLLPTFHSNVRLFTLLHSLS